MDKMMNKYEVEAPDGTKITRTTKKTYSHVVLVNINNNGWFGAFTSSLAGAIKTERKYENCPAVKQGAKVETKLVLLKKQS